MSVIRTAVLASSALALLLVAALSSACETPSAEAACRPGTAECLPKVSFMDTTNTVYPPEDMVGKVVVVNFWATWCKPCKKEIPAFNRVYEKYKDKGVMMFGVLTELDASNSEILNFASDAEMTYPIVRLENEVGREFGYPPSIPVTFIYDKKGVRQLDKVGALSEAELAGHIERLLAQP